MEEGRGTNEVQVAGVKREREPDALRSRNYQEETGDKKLWIRDGFDLEESSDDGIDSEDDVDLEEEEEDGEPAAGEVPEELDALLDQSHIDWQEKRKQRKKRRVAQVEEDTRSVFVGKLPGRATSQNVRARFSDFGQVVGVNVQSFKGKRSQRTFAYVEFAESAAATKAVQASPIRFHHTKCYVGAFRARPMVPSSRTDQTKRGATFTPTSKTPGSETSVKIELPPTVSTDSLDQKGGAAIKPGALETGGKGAGCSLSNEEMVSSSAYMSIPLSSALEKPSDPQSSRSPVGPFGATEDKKQPVLTTLPEITPVEEEPMEEKKKPPVFKVTEIEPIDEEPEEETHGKTAANENLETLPNPETKPGERALAPAHFKLVEMQDGSFRVLEAEASADVIDVHVAGDRGEEPAAEMEAVLTQEVKAGPLSAVADEPTPDDVSRPDLKTPDDVIPNPEVPAEADMDDDDDMPPLETIPGASPLSQTSGGFEMGATSAAGRHSHRRNKRKKEEKPPKVPYYRNYIRPRKAPIYTHMVVAAFGFFREKVLEKGERELCRELLEWLLSPEILRVIDKKQTFEGVLER